MEDRSREQILEEKIQYLIENNICSIAHFPSGMDGQIRGTNICFSTEANGRFRWWNSITEESFSSFEEVLDSLDPVMQTELLFHLDIFQEFKSSSKHL
jgi:hypothetical protein